MIKSESQQLTLINKNGDLGNVQSQVGLTENEAIKRLQKYGPNSIPEQKTRPWVIFLRKMWAPVPWMLEASILLELVLGKYVEAGIIGMLVVFNALMSTLQENKAHNACLLYTS